MANLLDQFGRPLFRFKAADSIEDEVTLERMNALLDAIYMNCLTSMTGGTFQKQKLGMTLNCRGAGGSTATHPYQGFNASSGATPKVTIQYGTHNSVIPTISGTPLAVDTALNILTLGGSDTLVYIQLNLDGGFDVTSASIHSGTSLPTSTSSTSYQQLFAVAITLPSGVALVAVTDNVSGAQAFQYCGGSHLYGLV